jgi:hypothetical protein
LFLNSSGYFSLPENSGQQSNGSFNDVGRLRLNLIDSNASKALDAFKNRQSVGIIIAAFDNRVNESVPSADITTWRDPWVKLCILSFRCIETAVQRADWRWRSECNWQSLPPSDCALYDYARVTITDKDYKGKSKLLLLHGPMAFSYPEADVIAYVTANTIFKSLKAVVFVLQNEIRVFWTNLA